MRMTNTSVVLRRLTPDDKILYLQGRNSWSDSLQDAIVFPTHLEKLQSICEALDLKAAPHKHELVPVKLSIKDRT